MYKFDTYSDQLECMILNYMFIHLYNLHRFAIWPMQMIFYWLHTAIHDKIQSNSCASA